MVIPVLLRLIVFSVAALMFGQVEFVANYDESKVRKYLLPDPLVSTSGSPVRTAAAWKSRRAELFALFEREMFGRMPGRAPRTVFEPVSRSAGALGGTAIRKEIDVLFDGRKDGPRMRMLLYLPAKARGRVPVFAGLNFPGNHAVANDPGISLGTAWTREALGTHAAGKYTPGPAAESTRGAQAARWSIDLILARGYGVATAHYWDIDPDFDDGFSNGVHALFPKRAADEWATAAAWAWGMRRMMDYLETDPGVDAKRVALIGHSRLGKAALWAGAADERFSIVIANNSGEGGAALARRNFGETTWRINTAFPHWFVANYKKYNDKEETMPFDQHELLALIAPRPLYVASAEEDQWADPRGEFLSLKHADPVWKLLGKEGLGVEEMPRVNQPVGKYNGYHVRTGKHDVTRYDWEQYIAFADRHWRK